MSTSSHESRVSLIDLSQQFPFEIDDKIKEELCFGETLIVSCGHYEGDIGDEDSESEWSCHDTTETETSEGKEVDSKVEMTLPPEINFTDDKIEEEDNDFHFYFFPDCEKPQPPQDSHASLIIVDGMPKINISAAQARITCTCKFDKTGKCDCFTKLPCKCGAKTKAECTCGTLKEICICHDGKPQPICKCRGSDVCVCSPDGKIKPVCTCADVDKPCVCYADKFPCPVCTCKRKPRIIDAQDEQSQVGGEGEVYGEDYVSVGKSIIEMEPCVCQKPDPKPRCFCLKGKECTCKELACVCGVQKVCVCEPTDSKEIVCIEEDNKSVCSCAITKECTCDAQSPSDCKCHVIPICACGDPANCRCSKICDCTDPCICDTAPVKPDECICLDKKAPPGQICTCPRQTDDARKLKKVRAGKHGYRWCHEVDPQHTYFDYGYGRHDKISYKVLDREKIKILGLHEEKSEEDICPIHSVKAPPYVKKVRKPSIDCCSSVGGISVCVETLGEDKGRFLVQVVSHSSKEGAKTGSKLISILDCNLHTMEENRIEHIIKKAVTKERRSYMAICDSGYYNKVTRICGDKNVAKRFYHSFDKAHDFLLEGANVVLMRYMGLRRYRGNIKTETVLMDGTICESIYVCQGVSQAIVNGKPLFVVKIERHIIEPTGYIHQTLTVLTLRGHMVSHEWADNCYVLHINPLLNIVPEKDEIEPHAPLRERWREDLQLHSDYLDFKSSRLSEGARYVMESGALTGAVRDYLQAILHLRPQDTLHFTRHYFGSVLSALDLPHDEYFDPSFKHVRYYFFEE